MITDKEKENLITQLESYLGTRPFLYMKFCSKKEYAQDVIDGNLFANTPEYFRKLELTTGVRGQGDINELILSFDALNVRCYDYNTGQLAFMLHSPKVSIKFDDDSNKPIVSFVGISIRQMILVDANENCAEFDFPFNKEEFEKMQSEFGAYCVLIGAREIESKIFSYCERNNKDFVFDAVQYVSPNTIQKMKAYQEATGERFLFKDMDLYYQREYRLALNMKMPDDHYIRIGSLRTAKIIDSNNLKDMRFSITYKSVPKDS